ncbi:MAG: hypothetical protein ABIO39_12470 [Caulobacteraceae bacterium]
MPVRAPRLSLLIAIVGVSLAGCATATTDAGKTANDIERAGLKGPIEARGPATATPQRTEPKTGPLANAGRAVYFDREKDRWYFYDDKRHRYRWENGEPKT